MIKPAAGFDSFASRVITLATCGVLFLPALLYADNTHAKNKKASKLYEKGQYEEALKTYEDASLESPDNLKLRMNKGSTLHRLQQFDKAEEEFKAAEGIKDKKALADLYYNRGNNQFRQGQMAESGGGQNAKELYQAALENYIKTLDVRPEDKDAKWNLQLAQVKVKEQEQKKDQDKKQDKKDQDQQDKKDQDQQDKKGQDQQDKKDQDKKDQDKKEQEKKEQEKKEQNQKQDQNQDKQQKPQPQPQSAEEKKEQQKKQEAARLLMQFSDDAKELNKPIRIKVAKEKQPEKDW